MRCKGVYCVDLGESFPTRIYLQKSASIQPRTSPSKFGGKIQFNIHFTPYSLHFLVRLGVPRTPRLCLGPTERELERHLLELRGVVLLEDQRVLRPRRDARVHQLQELPGRVARQWQPVADDA